METLRYSLTLKMLDLSFRLPWSWAG